MDKPLQDWINAHRFAALAKISVRMAREALKLAHVGKPWRGFDLTVRLMSGNGGLQYQVSVDSLPEWMRPRQAEEASPLPESVGSVASGASPIVTTAQALPPVLPANLPAAPRPRFHGGDWEWRLELLRPALAQPFGSAERAATLDEIAATARYVGGERRGKPISKRTLYAWIKAYDKEGGGVHQLMRKAREDRGKKRVTLSRKWDALADQAALTDDVRAEIAAAVVKRLKSLWAAGTPSWPTVQLNCMPYVMELSRKAGIATDDDALREACLLPKALVKKDWRYRAVAIKKNDAGRSAAIQTPRVRRDRSHLKPMEWVAGDVHHIDVLVRREDGSLCTPKMVAWLDLATNRVFARVFLMPKHQMIRREHVIETFVAMCADPNWGVPSHLYIDNGGEYNFSEFAEDLGKLKYAIDCHVKGQPVNPGDGRSVRRSLPYNPQSKVIETTFAAFERSIFPQLPGHIGGERMKKKTQNQGKEPEPYPGSFEDFTKSVATGIEYYHWKPQAGHLGGLSPYQRFKQLIDDGWKSILLDPAELAVAFSQAYRREVMAGGELSFNGKRYRHDALLALAGVGSVIVYAPLFGDRERLTVFDDEEQPLCVATPVDRYAFDDGRGAGEQQRMNAAFNREIRAMKAETDDINLESAMAATVAAHGASPTAESDGVASVRPEFRKAAKLAQSAPAVAANSAALSANERRKRQTEIRRRMLAAG